MTLKSAACSKLKLSSSVLKAVLRGALVSALAGLALALAVAAASVGLGFRPIVVHGGSMGDSIPAGSLVMARWVPADDLSVGDVIVVQEGGDGARHAPYIHRIVSLEHDGDQIVVRTRGEANQAVDPGLHVVPDRVLEYSYHVPYIGFFVGFVTTTAGWITLILLPAVVLCTMTMRSIWFPSRRQATVRFEPNEL